MLGDISYVENIYIRTGYTDMRKQLNGLVDIIQYSFKLDPYSTSLFLFCGRRADRIKAVHYEGDGFCLLYKRYESGRLKWPRTGEEAKQISEQQLRWLLEGLNPEQPKAVQKWYPGNPQNLGNSAEILGNPAFLWYNKTIKMQEAEDLSDRERQYQNQITELEQQIRLLKEQVDFLTRKLYGTKSEKTSALDIEGQMSLFNETEYFADPDAKEPELVEVEKHLRKRKYTGQREELIKDLPHSKVLHTIDESEQVCEKCGSSMVKVGEEFVCTEVQFIGKLTSTDPAGNRERHIWKKHRFHIRRSCIPLHPHPRSHG